MANGSGLVQRGPLPPLNSPTISEADRGRVYGAIGKELNNILNGPASHHSDSVKRSSNDLRSELNDFIDAVKSLKNALSDPANIVDDAVRDLEVFRKAFEAGVSNDIETMWNDSKDERDKGVKLPDHLVPFTRDNRIIDPEPTPGPFSVPNPLSPDQWRKDLRASTGSPDVEAASAADSYPQLARRVTRFAPGTSPMTTKQLPLSPEPSRPLGLLTGKPMSLSPFQLPLDGLSDNSNASGNNDSFNLMAGLVSQNPAPPAPPLQAGSMPERWLGRRVVNPSPASVFDRGAPAVPFVSSEAPDFPGGLLGRYAALAGADPQIPPDDEQEQPDLQALEDRLTSSGNIRDAVALYNARRAGRR